MARNIKGKKTPENGRALEDRVAALEAKTDNGSNERYSQIKSPKLAAKIIQPLTERKTTTDRAMQALDCWGH